MFADNLLRFDLHDLVRRMLPLLRDRLLLLRVLSLDAEVQRDGCQHFCCNDNHNCDQAGMISNSAITKLLGF